MKTVAIFAHYDSNNTLKDYVFYYLQELSRIADDIILVSTSVLAEYELSQLSGLNIQVVLRENIGHDFYSYKVGLAQIENLASVDKLILCNDSCFGPLFDLPQVYSKLLTQSGDFWGISTNQRPVLHLQSYFLVLNHTIVNSSSFHDFWSNVDILNNKDRIVMQYEVGLSQHLIEAGFELSSWLPINNYKIKPLCLIQRKVQIFFGEMKHKNSRYSWKNLFEPLDRVDKTISLFDVSIQQHHLPFLKKSLFNDQWISRNKIIELIEQSTSYNSALIKEALHD